MRQLVIIGAGGHGRVIADIALAMDRYDTMIWLDDDANASVVPNGKVSDFLAYVETSDFVVAIGNNSVRAKVAETLRSEGVAFAKLIHPAAVLGSGVTVGDGTVIMPGAVVNNGVQIGEGVIINTCASVDHDSVVGDFCHISVGSHLAGDVLVGDRSFICAGATVINGVRIASDTVVGAGAVVIHNIEESGTYVGVPARKVK